mmetsp:Transcript_1890/g.2816  ORF Transcript_1890/g.2816 Transcript_1890/m.2816 type:complete len:91 (+) Transcript_1890:767-1039(+)
MREQKKCRKSDSKGCRIEETKHIIMSRKERSGGISRESPASFVSFGTGYAHHSSRRRGVLERSLAQRITCPPTQSPAARDQHTRWKQQDT